MVRRSLSLVKGVAYRRLFRATGFAPACSSAIMDSEVPYTASNPISGKACTKERLCLHR